MTVTVTALSAVIEDSVWLVEINPAVYAGSENPAPFFMVAAVPVAGFDSNVSTTAVSVAATFVMSDRGWIREPNDSSVVSTVSNFYPPRLTEPPAIERRAPIYIADARKSSVDAGELVVSNVDGGADILAGEWAVAGRNVVIYRAPHRRPYHARRDTWTQIAKMRATGPFVGSESLRMPLQSAAADLSTAACPIYEGTGDTNGDATLKGVFVPRVYGYVRNVQPVLIDQARLIYQVNSGPIDSFVAVRDGGVALTADSPADYASYAALASTSVTAAKYKTCLAEGIVRLGAVPVFVTADVRGSTAGSGYASTTREIAAQILTHLGGLTITASSFTQWPNYKAGILLRDGSIEDAINRLAGGLGTAWWGPDTLGQFAGYSLSDPSLATAAYVLREDMLLSPPEEITGVTPPWWQVRIAYQEIDAVQTGGDILAAATAADREYYGRKRRFGTASDYSIKATYPLAVDGPEMPGVLENATEASTLADSLLTIFKIPRRSWLVKLGPNANGVYWWSLPLGTVVQLIWPHISTLANGKNFVVKGISARGDYVELELWG